MAVKIESLLEHNFDRGEVCISRVKLKILSVEDKGVWLDFAHRVSDKIIRTLIPDTAVFYEGFDEYMESKIRKMEAYIALDEQTNDCAGIIAFSKSHNKITFFGVSESYDFDLVGKRLISSVLDKLDSSKDITANVLKGDFTQLLNEKKIYEKYGFICVDDSIYEAGVPAYMMKLYSKNRHVVIKRPTSYRPPSKKTRDFT